MMGEKHETFCKYCKEEKSQQQFIHSRDKIEPYDVWTRMSFDEDFCKTCKICECDHPKVWHYSDLGGCMGDEDTCDCWRYRSKKRKKATSQVVNRMAIVLEHFNCKDCGSKKFNVVLFKGSFLNTTVKNIICIKCGLIYNNVPLASKKQRSKS